MLTASRGHTRGRSIRSPSASPIRATGTGHPPDYMKQKHDIGRQKRVKNKMLNPPKMTQEDRRKQWYKHRGLPVPPKPAPLQW